MALDLRKRHQASADDTQSFLNLLLLLKDAEVVCLFREEDDSQVRVSIKSKGKVVINKVAMELGGGGHDYSARRTYEPSSVATMILSPAAMKGGTWIFRPFSSTAVL